MRFSAQALRQRDPFTIGIAAFVGLGLLGVLLVVFSRASFGTDAYYALLPQTAGIRVGESVQVAGVDSGKVRSIELEGHHVRLGFTLDRGIHLGRETTAQVKVATLLGTHMLAVDPRGPGDLNDDTIPLSQTSVPYNLQDVIDQGTGALQKLDSKLLGQALGTVADTLRTSGPELLPALRGIDRISDVVSQRSVQFGQLLQASRRVSDQLSASSGDLVRLMKQTDLVVQELTQRREAIHRLLVDVADLSTSVRSMISQTKADVGPALRDLERVQTVLRAHDADLREVLHNLAVGSRYIANATGNGPWIELYFPQGLTDDAECQQSPGDCR
jgi:phospholipid/cholesterol/gamma-HCH transport system substrate-binding protein